MSATPLAAPRKRGLLRLLVGIEDPAERHTGDDEAQRVGEQEHRAEQALGDGHPMDEYRQHQAGHDGEDQEGWQGLQPRHLPRHQ